MVEIIKEANQEELTHNLPVENVASQVVETLETKLDDPIDEAAKVLAGIEDEKTLSEKTVSKANLLKRIMQKLGHHISNPLGK